MKEGIWFHVINFNFIKKLKVNSRYLIKYFPLFLLDEYRYMTINANILGFCHFPKQNCTYYTRHYHFHSHISVYNRIWILHSWQRETVHSSLCYNYRINPISNFNSKRISLEFMSLVTIILQSKCHDFWFWIHFMLLQINRSLLNIIFQTLYIQLSDFLCSLF